jgi:hypothetical protein
LKQNLIWIVFDFENKNKYKSQTNNKDQMFCDDKMTRGIIKCHKKLEFPSILQPFSYKKPHS